MSAKHRRGTKPTLVIAAMAAATLAAAMFWTQHTAQSIRGSTSTTQQVPVSTILQPASQEEEDEKELDCMNVTAHIWQQPYLHPALEMGHAWLKKPLQDTPELDVLIEPREAGVASSRIALHTYLAGPDFRAQHALLRAQQQHKQQHGEPHRGILVVAGGKALITRLILILKILREILHSKLPVEVAWQGSHEMNDRTLASLQQHFGPLSGFDVTAMPYPTVHRRVQLKRWVGKVAALLHCTFHEVLLLDADNIPLFDPEQHFNDPLYRQTGNLFWPDFWIDWVKEDVWPWLGLNKTSVQPVLSAGEGWSGRDAESGMLLIDRARWLHVLHWIFWINTWHDRLYQGMLFGDKDTFALGFALAGYAHMYRQVYLPPGGVFTWRPNAIVLKCAAGHKCQATDGWQLVGELQHTNTGRPAFLHRTMNKPSLDDKLWPEQLITGPLPTRWVRYYIAHNPQGPTKATWYHAAPNSAFQEVHIDPQPGNGMLTMRNDTTKQDQHITITPVIDARGGADHIRKADGSLHSGSNMQSTSNHGSQNCPLVMFSQYIQAMQMALPVGPEPGLECTCKNLLQQIHQGASQAGMKKGDARSRFKPQYGLGISQSLSKQYLYGTLKDSNSKEVPDGSPVAALRCSKEAEALSGPLRVMQQAHVALHWLKSQAGRDAFPSLFDATLS